MLLVNILCGALALAASARAASAGVELEICRLPGSLSEYSSKAIEVPAGMAFAADRGEGALAAGLDSRSDAPPVKVVTTAPVSLGPDNFCVRTPIKPLAAGMLEHALGRLFVATGVDLSRPGTAPLDRIYGVLQRSAE